MRGRALKNAKQKWRQLYHLPLTVRKAKFDGLLSKRTHTLSRPSGLRRNVAPIRWLLDLCPAGFGSEHQIDSDMRDQIQEEREELARSIAAVTRRRSVKAASGSLPCDKEFFLGYAQGIFAREHSQQFGSRRQSAIGAVDGLRKGGCICLPSSPKSCGSLPENAPRAPATAGVDPTEGGSPHEAASGFDGRRRSYGRHPSFSGGQPARA